MTNPADPLIRSGAAHVEEQEHLAAGLSSPQPDSDDETNAALEDRVHEPMLKTELPHLALSMFASGQSIRVRVGNPHAPSELYECVYESADEANTAMLDNGILTNQQIPDMAKPAGTGIELPMLTAQQLEAAGLKRHGGGNL